jgi:hypothetical protein
MITATNCNQSQRSFSFSECHTAAANLQLYQETTQSRKHITC